jgi:hypothetical protein
MAILRQNLREAGATTVRTVEAAVWTHDGMESFRQQGAGAGRLASDGLPVRTVRLRDVLAEEHVDLLKLDIEGAEVEVLEDCASDLASVDHLFVEYHSFADRKQRLAEMLHILAEAGFRLYLHVEQSPPSPFLARESLGEMDMQLNIYGVR